MLALLLACCCCCFFSKFRLVFLHRIRFSIRFWFVSNVFLKCFGCPFSPIWFIAVALSVLHTKCIQFDIISIWTPWLACLIHSLCLVCSLAPSIPLVSFTSISFSIRPCNALLFSRVELCFGSVWFWFDSTSFFCVPYLFCVYAWLDVSFLLLLLRSLALSLHLFAPNTSEWALSSAPAPNYVVSCTF